MLEVAQTASITLSEFQFPSKKVKNFTFVLFNASYSNRKIGSEWLTIRAYDWDSSRVSVRSIAVPYQYSIWDFEVGMTF